MKLEDPVYHVNEHDIGEVDPKVTEFLLHKPWYAGTKHGADQDTEADTDHDGAGAASIMGSAPTPKGVQGEAMFWIPQATPDGQLFYFNTLTGVSTSEVPVMFENQIPDWEKAAKDSSHLPYVDREDTKEFEAVVSEFVCINNDGLGDINSTLAKLEGKYAKSEADFSGKTSGAKSSVEEQWQAILTEARRKATQRYSGRTSICSDEDSIILSSFESPEPVATYDAGVERFKAQHERAGAKTRSKWRSFRYLYTRFGVQESKRTAQGSTAI